MKSLSSAHKIQLLVVVGVLTVATLLLFGLYDIIKIEWIGFMEIQPSYRPMEEPLPVPVNSIPIEGAAYVGGVGDIPNPVPADANSIERGRLLYSVTCVQCHGADATGNGIVGAALVNKPADLTGDVVQAKSDGSMFLTITNGIIGKVTVNGVATDEDQLRMPALNENLTVRDRWDIVNYIRDLQVAADRATPTPQP